MTNTNIPLDTRSLSRLTGSSWSGLMYRVLTASLLALLVSSTLPLDSKLLGNALIGIFGAFTPLYVAARYDIEAPDTLLAWVALAMTIHVVGMASVPTIGVPYTVFPWWDNVAHLVSGSVSAVVAVPAVILYQHYRGREFQPETTLLAIIGVVMLLGLAWEGIEIAFTLTAHILPAEPIVVNHGVTDTLSDLTMDFIGGWAGVTLLFATHLIDYTEALGDALAKAHLGE